jgi:phosphoglycerate kinase
VAKRLQRLLGKEISFSQEPVGPQAQTMVERLGAGDVLLLENLRFHAGEMANDPVFSKALADLGIDVYINDAFGTVHRSHASVTGITHFVKSMGCGFLMKKEMQYLVKAVENPARPFVVILGGGKISGKIGVSDNLGKKADKIIIGGGMAFTFLKAMGYDIGDSMVEDSMLSFARDVRRHAIERGVKF